MKTSCFSALLLLLAIPSAFAGNERYSIVGGVDYNLGSASASVGPLSGTTQGTLGYVGGLLVGVNVFEVGALYRVRRFNTSITGRPDTSSSVTSVTVPVMVRFGHATSFGVGGFVDLGSNDSTNFGLSAGPRFGGSDKGFFLDLRFDYSLDSDNQDVLALIGYTLGK